MPNLTLSVLIVEDDMIVGTHISMLLSEAGYEVNGVLPSAEAALNHLEAHTPDLILMDINLKGEMDGIEAAKYIYEHMQLPVIFLTANSDPGTFQRAKVAFPHAFITKPFQADTLLQAIELATYRTKETEQPPSKPLDSKPTEKTLALSDRIFVRDKEKMVKIAIDDIHYVKAERNYCTIVTKEKSFTLSLPLKTFEERVSSSLLFRVHRSYLVNLTHVESLDEYYVFCHGEAIPVGKTYKKDLIQRLNVL